MGAFKKKTMTCRVLWAMWLFCIISDTSASLVIQFLFIYLVFEFRFIVLSKKLPDIAIHHNRKVEAVKSNRHVCITVPCASAGSQQGGEENTKAEGSVHQVDSPIPSWPPSSTSKAPSGKRCTDQCHRSLPGRVSKPFQPFILAFRSLPPRLSLEGPQSPHIRPSPVQMWEEVFRQRRGFLVKSWSG